MPSNFILVFSQYFSAVVTLHWACFFFFKIKKRRLCSVDNCFICNAMMCASCSFSTNSWRCWNWLWVQGVSPSRSPKIHLWNISATLFDSFQLVLMLREIWSFGSVMELEDSLFGCVGETRREWWWEPNCSASASALNWLQAFILKMNANQTSCGTELVLGILSLLIRDVQRNQSAWS